MPTKRIPAITRLDGGLNLATNKTMIGPNEWIAAHNAIVARPYNGAFSAATINKQGVAMMRPPMHRITPDTNTQLDYVDYGEDFDVLQYPSEHYGSKYILEPRNTGTWVVAAGANIAVSTTGPITQHDGGGGSILVSTTAPTGAQTVRLRMTDIQFKVQNRALPNMGFIGNQPRMGLFFQPNANQVDNIIFRVGVDTTNYWEFRSPVNLPWPGALGVIYDMFTEMFDNGFTRTIGFPVAPVGQFANFGFFEIEFTHPAVGAVALATIDSPYIRPMTRNTAGSYYYQAPVRQQTIASFSGTESVTSYDTKSKQVCGLATLNDYLSSQQPSGTPVESWTIVSGYHDARQSGSYASITLLGQQAWTMSAELTAGNFLNLTSEATRHLFLDMTNCGLEALNNLDHIRVRIGSGVGAYHYWDFLPGDLRGNSTATTLDMDWNAPDGTVGVPNVALVGLYVYVEVVLNGTAAAGEWCRYTFSNLRHIPIDPLTGTLKAMSGNIKALKFHNPNDKNQDTRAVCVCGDTLFVSDRDYRATPLKFEAAISRVVSYGSDTWQDKVFYDRAPNQENGFIDFSGTALQVTGQPLVDLYVGSTFGAFRVSVKNGAGAVYSAVFIERFLEFSVRAIAYHKNHLFVGGNAANPMRIYVSTLGRYTDFNRVKGYIDHFIDPDKSSEIKSGDITTGFQVFEGYMVVTRLMGIQILYGSSKYDFDLRPTSSAHGALTQDHICVFDRRMFFVSYDGLFELVGMRGVCRSDKVAPIFATTGGDTPESVFHGCLRYNPLRGILIYYRVRDFTVDPVNPLSSTPATERYTYLPETGAWGIIDDIPSKPEHTAFCGDFFPGYVYATNNAYPEYVEAGVTIFGWERSPVVAGLETRFMIQTGYTTLGDPHHMKMLDKLWLYAYGFNPLGGTDQLQVRVFPGFGGSPITLAFNGVDGEGMYSFLVPPAYGKAFSFEISSPGAINSQVGYWLESLKTLYQIEGID